VGGTVQAAAFQGPKGSDRKGRSRRAGETGRRPLRPTPVAVGDPREYANGTSAVQVHHLFKFLRNDENDISFLFFFLRHEGDRTTSVFT